MKTCAVVLAAGRSERFGTDKLWLDLEGQPLWLRSFTTFSLCPEVDAVCVVCQARRSAEFAALVPSALFVVEGGSDRQESSAIAVRNVPDDFDAVLIHDAARPFVSRELVGQVVMAVSEHGAAFAGVPVTDTVKQGAGQEWQTLDRARLVAAQTPQGAKRELLLRAHGAATTKMTDDVSLLEALGIPVALVAGDPANIKVTRPEDLSSRIAPTVETRTGLGYDIHPFSDDPARPLWLGGVQFRGEPGLQGHSDADVVLHAVVDALLGAAGLGDIGLRFPNTDPKWHGAPSRLFLEDTRERLGEAGWTIVNVDVTVIAEHPKVMPRSDEIRGQIGAALGLPRERINVKATTNEGLGSLGKGEGIAAYATATLSRPHDSR